MKATLEFDMENADDGMAHARCCKALDMALFISEFSEYMHRSHKDGVPVPTWEELRDRFYAMLGDRGLNMDDLIQ